MRGGEFEGPVLIAMATHPRDGVAPDVLACWRAGAAGSARLCKEAELHAYESRHDIPLIRPAEVAADIERIALVGAAVQPGWACGLPSKLGRGVLMKTDIHRAVVTAAHPTGARASYVLSADRRANVERRRAAGKVLREKVPCSTHAGWTPPPDRPDPISLLQMQAADRLTDLVPVRHGRMMASPLAFLRGAAVVMADDLAETPVSGLMVQACGDAHLANFGIFATAERHLVFDLNDFDETLPGPWEWDLKRLAASLVVAGRQSGRTRSECRSLVLEAARTYRDMMRELGLLGNLDVWYLRLDTDVIEATLTRSVRARAQKTVASAQRRDNLLAQAKLTEVVDGLTRIRDDPPLLIRAPAELASDRLSHVYDTYRRSLQHDRRILLDRYRFADAARKVVGVGSVGTRCYVALLHGVDDGDPLFIQIKEADRSVLEAHLPHSRFRSHGQRVVHGQRLMQAAGDMMLGWTRGDDGRDYYVRQLYDAKGTFDVGTMRSKGMQAYAGACAAALARAHARSADPAPIAGYLGASDAFPEALADFAEAYADQTERDHSALMTAVKSGRLRAEPDL